MVKNNYKKIMMDNCTLQNFDLRMFLCNIDHKEISKERGNVDLSYSL